MVTVRQFTECFKYREKELVEEDKVLTGMGDKMYLDLDWLCEVYDAEYTVRIGESANIKVKIYDSDEAAGIYKILNRDKIIVAFTDFSDKPQVGIFALESDTKYIIKDGYVFISAKLKHLR